MDVVRLDSNYRPDVLVEGWSSMTWAERYSGLGEFSMVTPLIADSRAMIPEGSFISLLDSDEVMMVDSHIIERDDTGGAVNKITGSAFPTFLAERDTVGKGVNTDLYPNDWQLKRPYTPAQAVAALIWNHLVNNSTRFTGPSEDLNGDPMNKVGDPRLLIPNLRMTYSEPIGLWVDPTPDTSGEYDGPTGTRKWSLSRGSLDGPVFEILGLGKLGLRTVRPRDLSRRFISFSAAGDVAFSTQTASMLTMDVYQGRDLTEKIVFRYDAGQIDNPKYLYSIKGYKNIAHVSSAQKELIVAAPGTNPNVSGIERRVLYFDAGNLADLDIDGEFTDADWTRVLTQKALTELENHNKVALFDGEISPLADVKYGTDYRLGDRVTLQAEYDLDAEMMVSEYIRSQDADGETGYPTLTFVD